MDEFLDAQGVPHAVSTSHPLPVAPPSGVVTCTTSITRPPNTTTYTPGAAYADSTTAPTAGGFILAGAARAAGKSAILTDILVTNSNPGATALQGEIYIFDTAVAAPNDNATFAMSDAEVQTLVAKVPFAMAVGANNNHVQVQNLGIGVTTAASANLRFTVKVTNAYPPASAEVLTIRAKFLPVD